MACGQKIDFRLPKWLFYKDEGKISYCEPRKREVGLRIPDIRFDSRVLKR